MTLHPDIAIDMARELSAERRAAAARFRLARRARGAHGASHQTPREPVTIRPARDTDLPAIAQIAELESRPVPSGRPLVALRGGRLQAVLDLRTGEVLADPFLPTGDTVELIRAYAA